MTGRTIMSECPKCGGTDIELILYGLPQMSKDLKKKVNEKKIYFGSGGFGNNDPELNCNDCWWRY